MTKEPFDALWENIAKIEIDKTIKKANSRKIKIKLRESEQDLKSDIYRRYQSEKYNFKDTVGIDNYNRLGRNEVAASFYIAFIGKTDGDFFIIFDGENERAHNIDSALIHETAFNIAIGILESFISSNEKIDKGYRKYVEKNGIIFSGGENHKKEILKLLINAHNEKKLSIYMLVNIFTMLESDTRHCYEIATLKEQIKNREAKITA